MATLGELEPHDSQGITLGELEPMPIPEELGELVSHEDYKAAALERMAEQDVSERTMRLWSDMYDADPTTPTFDDTRAEQEKEKIVQAEKSITDKAYDAMVDTIKFTRGLKYGFLQMVGDAGETVVRDAPKVAKLANDWRLLAQEDAANLGLKLGAALKGEEPSVRVDFSQDSRFQLMPDVEVNDVEAGSKLEKDLKRRAKKAGTLLAEGTSREVLNSVNAGWNLIDHAQEMFTMEGIKDSRIKYERQIRNDFIDKAQSEGILNNLTRRKFGEEAYKTLQDGKAVIDFIDPTDELTAQRLNAIELVGPASLPLTAVGGKALQAFGLGDKLLKANRVTNSLGRKVFKKGAGTTARVAGALSEKPLRKISKEAGKASKKAKGLIGPAAFLDVITTGGSAIGTAVSTMIGGSIVNKIANKMANGAAKMRTYGKVLADSPDRHKRFLDILATEHGSSTAGLASKYYGTKAGDLLWDMAFDGAKVSALGAAEATLAGRDIEAIGEAAGGGLAGGAALGAAFGDRGAGSSTNLVNPDGTATARSLGSFDRANINKSRALADLDQANKMGGLPDEVKAAVGFYGEMGILPDNVILLDPKDFKLAASLMQTRIGENVEMNNSALYLPSDSTIFLNAKGKFTDGDGLRIMGEELGHHAMSNVIANDPTIVMTEAQRFSDPNGKLMLLSRSDKRRKQFAGEQGARYTRVNKEMADFIDQYNQAADASGAPRIETFEQALQEWFGAQAGISMASNKATISPSAPLWVHKVGLGIRNMQMKALGKSPRNTRSYAKSIDEAASTPMGKYTREQYKAWVRDLEQVEAKTDKIWNETTEPANVKTIEDALRELTNSDAVTGRVITKPEGAKKQPKPGDLVRVAKKYPHKVERQMVRLQNLPDEVISQWAMRYPEGQRQAMIDWLTGLRDDFQNRISWDGYYQNETGPDRGRIKFRNMQFTGRSSVRDVPAKFEPILDEQGNKIRDPKNKRKFLKKEVSPQRNGVLFLEVRDLPSLKKNYDKAAREGRTSKSFDDVVTELDADLQQFDADPKHVLSDQTLALMGEKKKGARKLNAPWSDFRAQRTLREVEADGIMGLGETSDGFTGFGQIGGQEGLMFANPIKVNQQ